MKRWMSLILALILALSLAACSSSGDTGSGSTGGGDTADSGDTGSSDTGSGDSQEDWITANWSFATWLTETNPFQENIVSLQKNLDEYCNGTIQITTYPSSTLLGPSDMLDGLDAGTAEMVYIQLDYFPNAFPVSQVMNYPGINYNSALVASKVWREFQETFPDIQAEYEGYVPWMWQSSGPSCLFTNFPVTSLSDISGMQLAAVGSVNAEILEAWGAIPVTLDTSDIYEAMRNGLVSGRIGMYGACAMSNLDEVATDSIIFPMGSYSFIGLMRQDLFDSMPASQQEAFMKAVDATFNDTTIYYQDYGLAGNARVAECYNNVDTIFAEGAVLDEMTEKCSYMLEDYCAQLTEMGYDGEGAMAKLAELAEKYNQEMTWDEYAECYVDVSYFDGLYTPPQA